MFTRRPSVVPGRVVLTVALPGEIIAGASVAARGGESTRADARAVGTERTKHALTLSGRGQARTRPAAVPLCHRIVWACILTSRPTIARIADAA